MKNKFLLLVFLSVVCSSCVRTLDYRKSTVKFCTTWSNNSYGFIVNNDTVLASLAFPLSSPYIDITGNKAEVKAFDKSGTVRVYTNENLTINSSYTFFAYNPTNNPNFSLVQDNLTAPETGKSHIRFLYVAEIGKQFPVTIGVYNSIDSLVNKGRVFNDQSTNNAFVGFNAIKAGLYSLRVTATAGTVVNLPTVNLNDGKIYTILVNGTDIDSSGTTKKPILYASIINHN